MYLILILSFLIYQSLNMYVPPDETVHDLGEINMSFDREASTRSQGGARVVARKNPVYDNREQYVHY